MSADPNPIASGFAHKTAEYGPEFQGHLLEQYKLYVQSSQEITTRRSDANKYLLTINSSLVTLFAAATSTLGNQRWHAVVSIVGVLVCVAWYFIVKGYKEVNAAKFQVIDEFEKHLPCAPFRAEWKAFEHGKRGKYRPISNVELLVPVAFICLYLALAAYSLLARTK
jgi:hypothetical protein